jgi:hypothetical protein
MKSKVVLAAREGGVALNPMVLSVIALAFSLAIGSLPSQAQATNPFSGVASPKRLLIIAPGTFMSAVQPLVQHKDATGMPTVAVSISSLTAYFPGVDAPERIKRGIQYAHENLSTEYVMLVGDAHWFPVRYEFMQGLGSPLVDGDYIPSDLYYANLYHHVVFSVFGVQLVLPDGFDNWDANDNRKYNEGVWLQVPNPNPDNVDGYPDVAVGRVPAHSAADVTTFVNKVIFYETQTLNHFFFTFVADNNYSGATDLSTGIVANSGLKAFDGYLLINSGSNPPYPFSSAQTVDVANVADASTWVSYVGHGSRSGWDGMGADLVQDTANNTALPVVFAAGCSTGAYAPEAPGVNAYEYKDVSGKMWELVTETVMLGHTWLKDLISGQIWGCPICKPLPLISSKPNPYDFNEGAFGFAYPWLILYPRGGAIAYFGEVSVAEDWMGTELETDMLSDYQGGDRVLGSIYLTGERAYWNNHQGDVGGTADFHSQSRYYLGWMVFFGDPSLRMR